MSFTDRYGLAFTTSSAKAASHYREGLDMALAGNAGAEEEFAAATLEDEGFALAHVALARTLQFRGAAVDAKNEAARAREVAAGLSRREQQHIDCIVTAVEGNPAKSLELVKAHLAEFPLDAFAASQAMGVYGLIGFSGRVDRNDEQMAFCEKLAPAYGDDWWFLSQHAFALNELFRTAEARPLTERSLALYERNGHASHTMAHVFYEEGEPGDGAEFLDRWVVGYEPGAQLYGHLHWHLALFELAAGRPERALAIYDGILRPEVNPSPALGVIADAASLLWRSGISEHDEQSERWPSLAEWAATAFPKPGLTFADMHCALAFAAAHDQARMGQLIDGLTTRLEANRVPAGPVVVALARGVEAFANGDYARAVEELEPVRGEVVRIGGSHAQRDVFEETLLEAYLRAGRSEAAEALLTERLDRRPSIADERRLAAAARA